MKRLFAVLAMCLLFVGTVHAQMTDFVDGAPVYDARDNEVFVISNKLDFADLATYPDGGVTSASVVQLLNVPAGTIVNAVGLRVNTATATSSVTGVATIGDGADPDGWLTAWTIGAAASGVSSTYEDAVAGVYQTTDGGKYYGTADTIDLTFPTLGAWDYLAADPRSICTDYVVEAWFEGIKAPTQKSYGTLR